MSIVKVILNLLALVCIVQLQIVNAKLETVKKAHVFPGKSLRHSRYAIENKNIVFAACEEHGEVQNCTIVHQKYPYDVITHSCNISLKITFNNSRDRTWIDAMPYGEDKAILLWSERVDSKLFIKLTTIQMSDCQISEISLADLPGNKLYWTLYYNYLIVKYDDYYDVFTKGENSFDNDVRQIRDDSRTTSIEELNSHMKNINANARLFVFLMDNESPTKGIVYAEANATSYKVSMMGSDGISKILENYDTLPKRWFTSSGHNAIGVCTQLENAINLSCKQYEDNGRLQFTATLKNLTDATVTKTLYATPHDGFLLLIAELEDVRMNFEYSGFRIIRVDNKGEIIGVLRLEEFDNYVNKNWYAETSIFDNGDGKYCTTLLSWRGNNEMFDKRPDQLDVIASCFTEDDFVM